MVIMFVQISARCISWANWKILTRVQAAGYNLFANTALKRHSICCWYRSLQYVLKTFKLRGIIHTPIECCANPLSLVVSLDWCVNTLLCHKRQWRRFYVFCVSYIIAKGGRKTLHFFFSRHNCPLCIRLSNPFGWPNGQTQKTFVDIFSLLLLVMSLEDKCTQTAAPNEQPRHQCVYCERSYKQKSHLTYHVKSDHQSLVKKSNYRCFQCRVCRQGRKKKNTFSSSVSGGSNVFL